MVVQIRPMAVAAAVLCFFAIGIIGSLCGLSPDTCSKRAILGAIGAYLVTKLAVWAFNTIVTEAMIASQVNKDKEDAGDGQGPR